MKTASMLAPTQLAAAHAKQEEHRLARERAKQGEQARREYEHDVASTYGLRFVHVRTNHWSIHVHPFTPKSKGGVTVAYQLPPRKGDRLIRVSCAIVHENDAYNKRLGRFHAAKKFADGEAIQLRVPRNTAPAEFIKQMFGAML